MNKFSGMGRLTKDPELRTTASQLSVASFTVAINRRFKDASGQYQADFLPCVAWKQTGDFIAKYFKKGDMIGIVGSVQTRSWDANDGTKRYATEIIVEEAHFCGAKLDRTSEATKHPEPGEFFPGADDDTSLPFDI